MNTRAAKPTAGFDIRWAVHVAGALLLVGATVGAYVGLVEPAHRSRSERESRAQQAAQDGADLRALQDGTLAMERVSRTLEGRLIDTVELRGIEHLNRHMASVSELMEASRLRVTKLDPGDANALPRYTLVPIRVAGEGAFGDVLAFLHAMHTSLQDTEVRAFAVHSNAGSTDVGFEFALAWYTVQGSGGPGASGASKSAGRAGRTDPAVAGARENP